MEVPRPTSTPEREQLAHGDDLGPLRGVNLPVVHEDGASGDVKRLYERFRREFKRPRIPGILQCCATHPPLLEHMIGLAKSMLFVDGALGRENKEMISVFVSAKNRCAYCADSHGFSFRVQGGAADVLAAVLACDLRAPVVTPKQRTLLEFAGKVTDASQAITPADIHTMRMAGWSDLQMAETIHVTALFASFASFNRVVNAFGLPSQELLKGLAPEADDGAGS